MTKTTLNIPHMWADHHVLQVREILLNLAGVEQVYASAAWKQVLVTYHNRTIKKAEIEAALAEAGYPVGEDALPPVVPPTDTRQDQDQSSGFGYVRGV